LENVSPVVLPIRYLSTSGAGQVCAVIVEEKEGTMKEIELNREILMAMHSFDMDEVRKTDCYRAMVTESGGRVEEIELVIQEVMDKLRNKKNQMSPDDWNSLVNDIALLTDDSAS
jgi:hypothetical protein